MKTFVRVLAWLVPVGALLVAPGLQGADPPAPPETALSEPVVLKVWPGTAPGEKGDIGPEKVEDPRGEKPVTRLTNVTEPTLSIYRPAKDTSGGTCVVVCPGGGYHILAWDLEGTEVAAWLNGIGVTAAVLKYRVPRRAGRAPHDAPLQDAQRAVSLVRSKAGEWKIDPAKIGILGFSAGGHLSAATCTNFDRRHYDKLDTVDETSCRPDFAILVYPAYLSDGVQLKPEIRVTKETPPIFFAHAANDPISPENSVALFLGLKKAGVDSELHVYTTGGHGFGLRPSEHPCSTWPDRAAAWLKSRGLAK